MAIIQALAGWLEARDRTAKRVLADEVAAALAKAPGPLQTHSICEQVSMDGETWFDAHINRLSPWNRCARWRRQIHFVDGVPVNILTIRDDDGIPCVVREAECAGP